MAAATALAISSAAIGAGQMIMGAQQQKKGQIAADKAMAEQRALIEQGVVNQYAGLQAPTEAFDLAEEQTQRAVTEATVAVQEAGAEGVIGGVGNIVQAQQQAGLQTAAQRAQAEFDVDKMKAAEQARIDQMKYQGLVGLSQQELMGAQAASAEGRQGIMAGLGGIASGLAAAPGAVKDDRAAGDFFGYEPPKQ